MQWSLVAIGKTNADWIRTGTQEYAQRLAHYTRFQYTELPDPKRISNKASEEQVKLAEWAVWAKWLQNTAVQGTAVDHLLLLDERGKSFSSLEFAQHVEKLGLRGLKHCAMLIGGPYGFAPALRERADGLLSLGPMTFSHQMIRPFAAEQLYRAHTILRGEPYHHQ